MLQQDATVVRHNHSIYLEGKTPGSWIKHRLYAIGEFVIGGYLKRSDPYFDNIVGENAGAKLLYQEKVRFGFDNEKKRELVKRMEPLRSATCPFSNLPERNRRGSLNEKQMAQASGSSQAALHRRVYGEDGIRQYPRTWRIGEVL
jgi:bifunctional non-homologous end joining protein LigD